MSTPEGRNFGPGDIIDFTSLEQQVEFTEAPLAELPAEGVSKRFPPKPVTKGFGYVEMVPPEGDNA